MIQVDIAIEQTNYPVDCGLFEQGVRAVLAGESIDDARISLAVVDDPTIHELNRQYLQHDYATDVLSFLLSDSDEPIDGEVIVSADTAAREALRFDWEPNDELLLYVIHGTLHLVGYDDSTDALRAKMRAKEREYLAQFDRHPSYDDREASQSAIKLSESQEAES